MIFAEGAEVTDETEKMNCFRLFTEHFVPGRWETTRKPTLAEVQTTTVVRIPIDECSLKVFPHPQRRERKKRRKKKQSLLFT